MKGREMQDLSYQRHVSCPSVRDNIFQPVQRLLRRVRRLQPARRAAVLALSNGTAIETTVHCGDTLCIDNAQGFEIRLLSGCLWITQQDDSSDYVLDGRNVFRVQRNGTTLAHAVRDASVQVTHSAEAGKPSFRIGRAWRALGPVYPESRLRQEQTREGQHAGDLQRRSS
jgi:hypothetical protein